MTVLTEKHLRGIENRGINIETAVAMGLYSASRSRDGSVKPDPKGDILAFPYFEHDEEVNTKFRWADRDSGKKRFQQVTGAPKTLFNANVLLDDAMLLELESGAYEMIWTEGEFDCLAAIQAGYHHTVSVPDGAPPGRDAKGRAIEVPDDADDINPDEDDKFSFMARLMDRIQRVKWHIMAVDDDDSGQRLAKELVRRIGPPRCRFVEYPRDRVVPYTPKGGRSEQKRACKDLNEVLLYLGPETVQDMISNSKPWPVKGLFTIDDYPDEELPVMHETGMSPEFDKSFRIYSGAFMVVTGVPNVGKSTFANQMVVNMAATHKWHISMFSGEKGVKPFLKLELMQGFLKKPRDLWTGDDKERAMRFVRRYFSFIDHDPRLNDDDIDIDFLLDRAAASVFRFGTKLLLIDPWNELEHSYDRNISLTQYTGDAIRKMKRFGKAFDCAVCVVAHPTKMEKGAVPGLYSISDSAHWANKADLGLVVHADNPDGNARRAIIPKVRLKGIAGQTNFEGIDFDFDTKTGLFTPPTAKAATPF